MQSWTRLELRGFRDVEGSYEGLMGFCRVYGSKWLKGVAPKGFEVSVAFTAKQHTLLLDGTF